MRDDALMKLVEAAAASLHKIKIIARTGHATTPPADPFERPMSDWQRLRAIVDVANELLDPAHFPRESWARCGLGDPAYLLTPRRATENDQLSTRANVAVEGGVLDRTSQLAAANEWLHERIEAGKRAQDLRHEAYLQLARVEEDKRRRISRELHDQLGQLVNAVLLNLSALKRMPQAQTGEVSSQINALELIARNLDSAIDSLAWQLRPTVLDDCGLDEALAELTKGWSRYTGVPVQFDGSLFHAMRLPEPTETMLYRIAQEALTNIAKHAHASRVDFILQRRGDDALLVIEDDGVGFTPDAVSHDKGLGIASMRERAELVGASIEIESEPGKGTTVFVRAPPAT